MSIMHLTQSLGRAVQLQGERIAMTAGDRRLTWREFAERAMRLGGALTGLGLRPNDRVAMLAENGFPYLELHYGVPWAGGVIVPLNTRLSDAELIYILRDCGARYLLVDREYAARAAALRSQIPDLEHLIGLDDAAADLDYETLLERAEPVADCRRGGEDLLSIIYTGGTTGRPKGVALTHANLVANTFAVIPNMEFGEDTVYLHNSPLFHTSGSARIYAVVTCLARSVILPRFEPGAVLAAIAAERVTHVILVPTMLNRLLNHPAFANTDLGSLTNCAYGASIMPEALLRRALDQLPHVRFTQSYGMTELSPSATWLQPKYHVLEGANAGRLKSIGQAIHTAEVRIADEADRELPRGEVGEIQVRGPMIMQGYWNQPEATAQALRGGWMHTGDAGYMDDEGFIFLVDRIKDMIITGGENVYSGEVENALHEHPGVRECAVIGLPHSDFGEKVHAIVVPHPGVELTATELIAHCRRLIAGYKCPRSIDIRHEPLPLSGTNKVQKIRLREECLARG